MGNNIYSKKQIWKLFLLLFAIIIGVSSLMYTNQLVKKLAYEERKKVELWAQATKQLASPDAFNTNINLAVNIIHNNETVPVILTDKDYHIVSHRNLDSFRIANNPAYLENQLKKMMEGHNPIEIDLGQGNKNYIFHKDSTLLSQLSYYPYIQLGVIVLFILISYYAFSISRQAEQNQVWLGLSKETAHQLGTPTSSMMGWIELMRMKDIDNEIVDEIEKDVVRLQKITERFSKIGSKPIMKSTKLVDVLKNVINYLSHRFSNNVQLSLEIPDEQIMVSINEELFEWVIENVCKNAYDAISGKGHISLTVNESKHRVNIDIHDDGKGISKSKQKTIFKPGYTTKKRGWGLGLSLSKRIIENYHDGRIFVLHSEPGKGTTIRISLNQINS